MTSNKSRQCRSSPRKRGHFFCHRDARTATEIAPGDADGISPRGCGCGRRNGAPGHPRPHGGETHGQGAPGSRIIAQAATNEPRMDWAPILQGKGHGAHPGTHHGRIHPYYRKHLKGGQESRFKAALMTTERYKRTRGAPVLYYRSHLHVCQVTRQKSPGCRKTARNG